jgi:hypothetical protein
MLMRGRTQRIVIVLFVLALLWIGLPVPGTYPGGPGNYDVWCWGLYGWVRVFKGGGILGPQVHTVYSATGLAFTAAGSVLVAAVGALWARGGRGQRAAGFLVFLAPAALFVAQLWWPAVIGLSGGAGGSYQYFRGHFGYLIEERREFEVPEFPPYEAKITGPVRLDGTGLAITVAVSTVVLGGAGWLGSRVGRWAAPAP